MSKNYWLPALIWCACVLFDFGRLSNAMDPEAEIPQKFYDNMKCRIRTKAPNKKAFEKECWEWEGAMKLDSGYGIVHITIKGDRLCVHAHRAAYMAFNNKFILPYDISHCCHQSKCVNPDHLSHEWHSINMDREECRRVRKCSGHEMDGRILKSCILGPSKKE
jgi:hypothetical protein